MLKYFDAKDKYVVDEPSLWTVNGSVDIQYAGGTEHKSGNFTIQVGNIESYNPTELDPEPEPEITPNPQGGSESGEGESGSGEQGGEQGGGENPPSGGDDPVTPVDPTPTPSGNYNVKIIIKNETGRTIQSTGEIRLYVGDHIGINTYLPGANEAAGAKYAFNLGENDYSNYTINCSVNGSSNPVSNYTGQSVNDVKIYDYRHWQDTDAGFTSSVDTLDNRCNTTLINGGTYIIKLT